MNEFLLTYENPANNFNEALPIGNGFLGAMVYGRYPTETLTLNHDSLWTGTPHRFQRQGAYEAYRKAMEATDANDFKSAEKLIEEQFTGPFTDSYLPLGTLFFDCEKQDVGNYSRSLNLREGIAKTSCSSYCFEHFASYQYRCIVSHLSFSRKETIGIRFASMLRHDL